MLRFAYVYPAIYMIFTCCKEPNIFLRWGGWESKGLSHCSIGMIHDAKIVIKISKSYLWLVAKLSADSQRENHSLFSQMHMRFVEVTLAAFDLPVSCSQSCAIRGLLVFFTEDKAKVFHLHSCESTFFSWPSMSFSSWLQLERFSFSISSYTVILMK